ncbi:MAG: DNA polymerase [Bacilli bacterium]
MFILNGYRTANKTFEEKGYFVADFETSSTNESQEEVFVYATGLMNINDNENKMYYNNNIESFIDDLYKLPYLNTIIYFHNLSFDIEFILNYLVNKKGFTQLLNEYEYNNENMKIRVPKNYIKNPENKPHEKSFEIVYANGSFYQVIIYLKYISINKKGKEEITIKKVTFKDSYKLVAFPLKKIAKDFLNYSMPKDGIDHSIIRPKDYLLNSNEMFYLYDDVVVLKKFMNMVLIEGIQVKENYKVYLNNITIASQTLGEYKHLLWESFESGKFLKVKAFNDCFNNANIRKIEESNVNKKELFESVFPQLNFNVDAFLRRSYFGGIVFKNKKVVEKFLPEKTFGLVYDVNSLYPYTMRSKILPYGEPVYFEGQYEKSNVNKKEYPLYFQEITVKRFEIKEGYIPNIQIRDSIHFSSTVYAENNKYIDDGKEKYEPCTFVFTNVQLKRFLKSYNVLGLKYIQGYAFKGSYDMFNDYIDTFMEMKKNGEGAVRATAKLFLNSLYGKFGMNPMKEERIIQYEDNIFSTSIIDSDGNSTDYVEKGVYLPIASFITSYAREVLLSAIELVHDRLLYCDTDSIHIYGYEIPDINIHDKNLGAWKLEGKFTQAKYIGAKRYAELIDNKWDIKCCGLSRDIMAQLDINVFENCKYTKREIKKMLPNLYTKDDIFYYIDVDCKNKMTGLVRSKKKKYVKGGIIIKEQPYMINDKTILF